MGSYLRIFAPGLTRSADAAYGIIKVSPRREGAANAFKIDVIRLNDNDKISKEISATVSVWNEDSDRDTLVLL